LQYNQGILHRDGAYAFSQDYKKALELYHRAAEFGHSKAYVCLGYAYNNGEGVLKDEGKAAHYLELAAMMGDVVARYNLGCIDYQAGNIERAVRHFMIAISGGGDSSSLDRIRNMYTKGDATKEDYTKALQLCQEYLGEIKSAQRDEAAAFDNDEYRYY